MNRVLKIGAALSCGTFLVACEGVEGTRAYQGPNDFIAVGQDQGRDATSNLSDNAGIAVTPDGTQAWLIDDGIEGRASNRLDPVSGLPVVGGTPGVVYGNYQSGTPGIVDKVPRRIPRQVTATAITRPTTGHFHQSGQHRYQHSHGHKGPHTH